MRPVRYAVALAVVAALATACGYAPTPLPTTPTTAATTPAPAASPTPCDNALQSYAPKGALPAPKAMPAGSTMDDIYKRGRLVAGVSADTYLFASRNPLTGTIEGFDIDIVNAIAAAIFGTAKGHVQLRVITAADRIPLLQKHEVDVVVRTMTITCDRWKSIAFSAEYYHAGQKILVRRGSDITALSSLAGKRVCAPTGTSSMTTLIREEPTAVPVAAANHTGCLLKFQQGQVDAITGDDTVLAGLAAQDPYAVVAGTAFTDEPYGVGIPPDQVDLVRFVTGVLEAMRSDGAWLKSYNRWLAPTLGTAPTPPPLLYGRTP
jgi:polar amino acid transport system substrate-binding protein